MDEKFCTRKTSGILKLDNIKTSKQLTSSIDILQPCPSQEEVTITTKYYCIVYKAWPRVICIDKHYF